MNGRQLVEEALRLRPGLKVIIASGYSISEEKAAVSACGIRYLVKPFDKKQLGEALES